MPGGVSATRLLSAWVLCHWECGALWHGIKRPGIFHYAATPVQQPAPGNKTVRWVNVMVKKLTSFLWSLLLLPTVRLKEGDFPARGKCRHTTHYRKQKGLKRRDREEVKRRNDTCLRDRQGRVLSSLLWPVKCNAKYCFPIADENGSVICLCAQRKASIKCVWKLQPCVYIWLG